MGLSGPWAVIQRHANCQVGPAHGQESGDSVGPWAGPVIIKIAEIKF